jgi:DNA-binding protein H-NS
MVVMVFARNSCLTNKMHMSFGVERKGTMARKANLPNMSVVALTSLREQVNQRLAAHRIELEKQLDKLANTINLPSQSVRRGNGKRGTSPLLGKKVPSKYRGPAGETWSGRGARPRWLVAATKAGKKKLDHFLIK